MSVLDLRVEALVKGGLGLARGPSGTVLVEGALPGERVEVRPIGRRGGTQHGKVARVLEASPSRRDAPCSVYGRCGGCDLMHATVAAQREMKVGILQDCLQRLGRIEPPRVEVVGSPEFGYRWRVRLHGESGDDAVSLGYRRRRSRRIEPWQGCPLLTEPLQSAVDEMCRGPQDLLGRVREVSLLSGENGLSLSMVGTPELVARPRAVRDWLEPLGAREICLTREGELPTASGEGVEMRVGERQLRASARAFFQSNAALCHALVEEVLRPLPDRVGEAWDLYAGVGLFGSFLRRRARSLWAVESDPQAIPLLRHNLRGRGLDVFEGTELEFLRRRYPEPGVVVADPPRAGLPRQAYSLMPRGCRVVLVGCDPASFATDLAGLRKRGFRIESVKILDLYPQTSHFESVAHLVS